MRGPCKHEHGDFVNGYWLCGQCYQKMAERPTFIYCESVIAGGDDGHRRQMIRHSIIIRAESGLTLSQLILAMSRRLVATCNFTMQDASDYAVDLLQNLGEEFGCSEIDWTLEGAWEIVREDQEYWDRDSDYGDNT